MDTFDYKLKGVLVKGNETDLVRLWTKKPSKQNITNKSGI